MSRRHPRLSECKNMTDLVRGGFAQAVAPTTDTGWKRYGAGRECLAASTNLLKYADFAAAGSAGGWAKGWEGAGKTVGGTVTPTCSTTGGALSGGYQRIQYTSASDTNKAAEITTGTADSLFAGMVTAGDTLTLSAHVKGVLTGSVTGVTIKAYWWTAGGWYGESASLSAFLLTTGWARQSGQVVVPATVTRVGIAVRAYGIDTGEAVDLYVSNAMVEVSPAVTTYFDGSFSDCAWTGTAHASTSTRPASSLIDTGLVTIDSTGVTAAGTNVAYSRNAATGFYGPVIVTPAAKSAGWQAAVVAYWSDPVALFSQFCSVGDTLIPLSGDSRSYTKVNGGATPFDPPVVSYDPYASLPANVYKGETHQHSTASDGTNTELEMATAYKAAGFDFIIQTDHNVTGADPGVSGLLWIGGAEETVGGLTSTYSHIICWPQATHDASGVAQTVIDNADVAVLAHPKYQDHNTGDGYITLAECLALQNYDAISIWNGVVWPGQHDATDYWDAILTAGRRVWGTGAGDCHNTGDITNNTVATYVYAASKTQNNIKAAIKAGTFYASSGIAITVATTAVRMTVTCADACDFVFSGPGGIVQTTANATTATFWFLQGMRYVRCTATRRSDGKQAWTQPVFFS